MSCSARNLVYYSIGVESYYCNVYDATLPTREEETPAIMVQLETDAESLDGTVNLKPASCVYMYAYRYQSPSSKWRLGSHGKTF